MELGEMNALFLSLPPNLQNDENYAMCRALDRQFGRLMDFFREMLVWGDLERVDSKYYDDIAAMIRALYYSSELDDTTKYQILSGALQTYRDAGSSRAIIDLIGKMFPDSSFAPWYEYGGKPYHFKINAPTEPTEENIKKFIEVLQKVKAQRSVMDAIESKTYSIHLDIHSGEGIAIYERADEVLE